MSLDRPSLRRDRIVAAIVAVAVFAVLLPVTRQGFSFLDDGIWLVGAEALTRGQQLYGDVFTIYGPAKFVVLALFFAVAGTSAATMALVEALAVGVAAGAGTLAARRHGSGRLAWLVPIGILALGVIKLKIVAAGLFALALGWTIAGGLERRRALLLGAAGGIVAWFGLDAAVVAGGIAVATVAVALRHDRASVPVPHLLTGTAAFALVASVPLLWSMATGTTSTFVWNTLVYPVAHFGQEMGVSLPATLADGDLIGRPFAALDTGETLDPVWPAHEALRATAIRVVALAIFVVPVLALVTAWRRGDVRLAAIGGFALTSLAAVITRGDEPHVLDATLGSLWIAAMTLDRLRRPMAIGAGVVLAIGLAPLLLETVYLATTASRPTLRTWERPRAGIALASERVASLESGYADLDAHTPTVFWPFQPGMNFLFDVPLAHRQITLLGGEVRDADALVADLRRDPLPRVVLVQRFTLNGRTMRDLVPPLWSHLRSDYRVTGTIVETDDPAWVLEPIRGGAEARTRVPIDERLPDQRSRVADGTSPDLAAGARVGQSFRPDERGLSGLRVRWVTEAPGFTSRVEVVVWSTRDGRPDRPLRGFRIDVTFDEVPRTSVFDLGHVEGTANEEIMVELRIPDGAPAPVRLLWHEHGGKGDRFPSGTAFVNGQPVEADVYFASY